MNNPSGSRPDDAQAAAPPRRRRRRCPRPFPGCSRPAVAADGIEGQQAATGAATRPSRRSWPTRSRSRTGPTTSTRTTTRPVPDARGSSPRRRASRSTTSRTSTRTRSSSARSRRPLSQGQWIDRDIIVPDRLARRPPAQARLPRRSSTRARSRTSRTSRTSLASPAWDPNRDYSLPWQTYITGHRLRPEEGRRRDHLGRASCSTPPSRARSRCSTRWRTRSALFLLEMGADPDEGRPDRVRRGGGEASRGGGRRPDPPVHGERLHRRCSPRATSWRRWPGRATSSSPPAGQPEPQVRTSRTPAA